MVKKVYHEIFRYQRDFTLRYTVFLLVAIRLLGGDPAAGRLDALFTGLAGRRTPGLAVLVVRGERTVFQKCYGVRDLRSFEAIGPRTDFRLASFSKQFTAMAAMLLVRSGKLRYDQRLTAIFPDFPAWGGEITVRHLLTHTSGLPDYEELMGPEWSATRQISDREALSLIERKGQPRFRAGTRWAYSNSGYVLLGLIVARASGQPFEDFLRDHIFARLGMHGTVAHIKGHNEVPERAFGHSLENGKFVETDQSSTSATLGDGGIYSNLADLAKWDAALRSETMLSEAEMRPALTPVRLADGGQPHWPEAPGEDNLYPGQPVAYGFGWFLDPYQGHTRMWHTGTTVGFRTAIERFTKKRLTVIVLANRSDLDVNALALRAADLFYQ